MNTLIRRPTPPDSDSRFPREREAALRWVGVAWGLLIINTLGSAGREPIVPIPQAAFQLVTMASLLGAFAVALALNPRALLRPSSYLLLLSILAVTSGIAMLDQGLALGSIFRSWRLTTFLATLWLLSRWWQDALVLVRYHIRIYSAVLATVLLGLLASPGQAMTPSSEGRLAGILWPIAPTQVGQFAAIVAGLTVVLWLNRQVDGRSVLILIPPAVVILLLTYTRTATLGLLVGIGLAGISLISTSSRARRLVAGGIILASLVAVGLNSILHTWFRRGQDDDNFANLTGRKKVWDALLDQPRSFREYLFGTGLSDKSFGGLPIDNSWLAIYHEQGVVGVGIVSLVLAVLIGTAVLRPATPARGCAIFLLTYCITASYTETGLGDASPYLLHLCLAAALLTARRSEIGRSGQPDATSTTDGRSEHLSTEATP